MRALYQIGIGIVILLVIPGVFLLHAQGVSLGIAAYIPITDKNITNGQIISATNNGFHLSNKPYDPLIFGVVTQNPAVSFGVQQDSLTYPVISSGEVYVLVTSQNGNIKRGDLITTSSTPGVGMKATKSGYIVGSALTDYSSNDTKAQKLIPVSMNVHFYTTKASVATSFTDVLNFSALAASDEPVTVFKYVLAVLVILCSFVLGLFSFGKIASNGIQALGRNPLAARMIQLGIIFNVIITVAIVLGGVLVSLFILRL